MSNKRGITGSGVHIAPVNSKGVPPNELAYVATVFPVLAKAHKTTCVLAPPMVNLFGKLGKNTFGPGLHRSVRRIVENGNGFSNESG